MLIASALLLAIVTLPPMVSEPPSRLLMSIALPDDRSARGQRIESGACSHRAPCR
jgi:hypothetical protein